MKKLIVSLLVLALVLISTLSAFCEGERFNVRNGIIFGMSKDEVIQIEESNDSGKYNERKGNSIWYTPKLLAGIESGILMYDFIDDKLDAIQYYWDDFSDYDYNLGFNADRIEEYYNSLNGVLESKYEKVGHIDGKGNVSYLDIEKVVERTSINSRYTEIMAFDEYLAKDGDNYVVIFIEYSRFDWIELYEHTLIVDYVSVNSNVIDELYDKAQEKEEKRNSDL